MKISELIQHLQTQLAQHGDMTITRNYEHVAYEDIDESFIGQRCTRTHKIPLHVNANPDAVIETVLVLN